MTALIRFMSHDGVIVDAVVNERADVLRSYWDHDVVVRWGWGVDPNTWVHEWAVTPEGGHIRPDRVIAIEEVD